MNIVRLARLLCIPLMLAAGSSAAQSAAEHIALGDREHLAFKPVAALAHYEDAIALDATNGDALAKGEVDNSKLVTWGQGLLLSFGLVVATAEKDKQATR